MSAATGPDEDMGRSGFGRDFRPSGTVSLTTDFGLGDGYVGVMHGVCLRVDPGLRVVDLTHAVRPQDVLEGAFHLRHAWRHFGPGAVHLAVVDPGVGTTRRSVLALAEGQAFIAPDNGLLPALLEGVPGAAFGFLDAGRLLAPGASRTFHGRDLYAPAAAALAAGQETPEACIARTVSAAGLVRYDLAAPRAVDGGVEGCVVHVDRFGNAISNVEVAMPEVAALLGRGGAVVEVAGRRLPVLGTYGEAEPGEALALADSFGLLEVAVAGGDAARALGIGLGEPIRLRAS